MLRRSYRRTILSVSTPVRYVISVTGSVLFFLVIGLMLLYRPEWTMTTLKVVLPIGMLLLGALWGLMRLPWFLSFIPPCGLFTLFCFLRLEGIGALRYLVGYVPICLAGALVVYTLVHYFVMRRSMAEEDT